MAKELTDGATPAVSDKATVSSLPKRIWLAIKNTVLADNAMGLFLRAALFSVLITAALMVLFFAFPPFSTGIMLQLGTLLGPFAFWTLAPSYASAVTVVVAETYAMVLALTTLLSGMAELVIRLINFCKTPAMPGAVQEPSKERESTDQDMPSKDAKIDTGIMPPPVHPSPFAKPKKETALDGTTAPAASAGM